MANSVSRKLIIAEAKKRHLRVSSIGHDDYFCKLTDQAGHTELIRSSRPLKSSANGFVISKYKDLTMEYAESLGYRVPGYITLREVDGAATDFLKRYKTVVVKPVDAQQSLGVTTSVTTGEQLTAAMKLARSNSFSGRVIVQQQLDGKLYRLLVINGKFVAAAQRKAPEVTGNGQHSIRQLIERLNKDPRRGEDSSTPLKKIKLTDSEAFLGAEGLSVIPEPGQLVKVSALDSVSAGGEAINVTEAVHPDWQRVTTDLAEQIKLFVCGYDVICEDISQPIENNYLPLLEINSAPGLKLHHYPTGGGKPIDVAAILLNELFGIVQNT